MKCLSDFKLSEVFHCNAGDYKSFKDDNRKDVILVLVDV